MTTLTLDDIKAVARRQKRVRLASLAQFINDNMPEFKAQMEYVSGSNDRKSGRLRIPGKPYEGQRLVVYERATMYRILEHNPFETYRENREVADWIEVRIEPRPCPQCGANLRLNDWSHQWRNGVLVCMKSIRDAT